MANNLRRYCIALLHIFLIDIHESTFWRILHKDLHLPSYKIQLTQELKLTDHYPPRNSVNWLFEDGAGFSHKIIISDEAHYILDGFVNKQNYHIWGEENSRVVSEKSWHPQKCTVWCGFWAGGITGPFFFEDENEKPATVDGHRYRQLIENLLWPEFEGIDIDDLHFPEDGATRHKTRENIVLLRFKFGHLDHVIKLH